MRRAPVRAAGRDVVLAVAATQRPDSLARLVRSLEPVARDRGVHLLVLDNGPQHDDACARVIGSSARQAAGARRVVRAPRALLPLHEARTALTGSILELSGELPSPPIVWMLDDDVSFERVHLHAGRLGVCNIARSHMARVRRIDVELQGACDVLTGGFTGDPPVRPESVLGSQLLDLSQALEVCAGSPPGASFELLPRPWAARDYYYDHAEPEHAAAADLRYPWLPREGSGPSVAAQLVDMLTEATDIPRGRTPFRPLLGDEAEGELTRVTSARRGGNAVFYSLEALEAHTYPAFELGGRWTRRADMIGATLLARGARHPVWAGGPKLRHDRRGQAMIGSDSGAWVPEFAGVLLARLAMRGCPPGGVRGAVRAMALRRRRRIERSLDRAARGVHASRAGLERSTAWWWREDETRAAAEALRGVLERLSADIEALRATDWRALLEDESLVEGVASTWSSLQRRSQAA